MDIELLLFGVTKDIIGGNVYKFQMEGKSVGDLRNQLIQSFERLKGLNSLMIAVNNEYAADDLILQPTDEIALIPPVSGG